MKEALLPKGTFTGHPVVSLHTDKAWVSGDMRAGSIEVWPAAGGGMLLGMVVPALSGARLLPRAVKNLFLRIDTQSAPTVIVPYSALESEVRGCIADMTAAELGLSAGTVAIDNRLTGKGTAAGRAVADLGPDGEFGLTLLAALARILLTQAAAERWAVDAGDCRAENGEIHGFDGTQQALYTELAGEAAQLALPATVILSTGHRVALSGALRPGCRRIP